MKEKEEKNQKNNPFPIKEIKERIEKLREHPLTPEECFYKDLRTAIENWGETYLIEEKIDPKKVIKRFEDNYKSK